VKIERDPLNTQHAQHRPKPRTDEEEEDADADDEDEAVLIREPITNEDPEEANGFQWHQEPLDT
jgi:hypothetical protein